MYQAFHKITFLKINYKFVSVSIELILNISQFLQHKMNHRRILVNMRWLQNNFLIQVHLDKPVTNNHNNNIGTQTLSVCPLIIVITQTESISIKLFEVSF